MARSSHETKSQKLWNEFSMQAKCADGAAELSFALCAQFAHEHVHGEYNGRSVVGVNEFGIQIENKQRASSSISDGLDFKSERVSRIFSANNNQTTNSGCVREPNQVKSLRWTTTTKNNIYSNKSSLQILAASLTHKPTKRDQFEIVTW